LHRLLHCIDYLTLIFVGRGVGHFVITGQNVVFTLLWVHFYQYLMCIVNIIKKHRYKVLFRPSIQKRLQGCKRTSEAFNHVSRYFLNSFMSLQFLLEHLLPSEVIEMSFIINSYFNWRRGETSYGLIMSSFLGLVFSFQISLKLKGNGYLIRIFV